MRILRGLEPEVNRKFALFAVIGGNPPTEKKMATETVRYNAAAPAEQETARRVWELLFKAAAKINAQEYADCYEVAGEAWKKFTTRTDPRRRRNAKFSKNRPLCAPRPQKTLAIEI